MRKATFVALPLLLASFAAAQVPTSGNVFFGYSYFNTDLTAGNRFNTNGWEASFEGKIVPFLGLVADFDGHYSGTVNFPVSDCSGIGCPVSPPSGPIPSSGGYLSANISEHNFLFGPRVSFPAGRFRPFGEFLFGAAHMNANAAGSGTSTSFGSDNSFATAVGGGIDCRIIRRVAWRFQGDYIHTSLFGTRQNNVRLSTGIVLRF
jgi:hypothetical protein